MILAQGQAGAEKGCSAPSDMMFIPHGSGRGYACPALATGLVNAIFHCNGICGGRSGRPFADHLLCR